MQSGLSVPAGPGINEERGPNGPPFARTSDPPPWGGVNGQPGPGPTGRGASEPDATRPPGSSKGSVDKISAAGRV